MYDKLKFETHLREIPQVRFFYPSLIGPRKVCAVKFLDHFTLHIFRQQSVFLHPRNGIDAGSEDTHIGIAHDGNRAVGIIHFLGQQISIPADFQIGNHTVNLLNSQQIVVGRVVIAGKLHHIASLAIGSDRFEHSFNIQTRKVVRVSV